MSQGATHQVGPGSAGKEAILGITHITVKLQLYTRIRQYVGLATHTHTRLTALFPGLPGWAGTRTHTHTHKHPFNGPLSGTTRVSRYQKGKTNLDFTEARHSEWQWHQQEHMQVCTSLQTDNHANTPPLSFLQAGCPSCRPTNSVKALKALCRPSNIKVNKQHDTTF